MDSVESLNPQIDYIEDPIPYDELEWARLQERVTLAADQFADKALHKPEVARYLILKPAKMDLTPYRNCSQKCVITSYVAHPLEQLSASWEAANFYQQHTEICGLASHNAYKSNPYQNALVSTGPYLKTPTGYGFGFDEMLTNEKWIEL